jgi:hypothetical protein
LGNYTKSKKEGVSKEYSELKNLKIRLTTTLKLACGRQGSLIFSTFPLGIKGKKVMKIRLIIF